VIFLNWEEALISLLTLGKIIAKIADLGSKKAGLSSDFWENCMIFKKISIGKRPFFRFCYLSRKITARCNEKY
jgi:hypothetical protein